MIALAADSYAISANLPSYQNQGRKQEVRESSDSDKNAGQQTPGPYFGELRHLAVDQDSDSDKKVDKTSDPLGRGAVLDCMV